MENRSQTSTSRALLRLLLCSCGVLLVWHFAITILYLLPLNPVRLAYGEVVDAYIVPYFRQRWALFAPDPPLDNKILTLRCRIEQGGVIEETSWHDLDTFVLQARRRNLLSSLERFGRVNRAVLASSLGAQDTVSSLVNEQIDRRFKDAPPRDEEGVDEEERRWARASALVVQRKQDEVTAVRPFVYRAGYATCQALYPGRHIVGSQFRIVLHEFPRYSDRAKPDSEGPKRAFMLEWGDAQPGVAALEI